MSTLDNEIFFDNSGLGALPGTSFIGNTPQVISYNTIGAAAVRALVDSMNESVKCEESKLSWSTYLFSIYRASITFVYTRFNVAHANYVVLTCNVRRSVVRGTAHTCIW